MEWWKIIYWLVATLGVAGTIALFVFAPSIFTIAFNAVVRFFTLLVSYRAGCALLAAIAAFVVADYWRHSRDDARFAARVAAFEQAQTDRDERIAQETREAVWKEIADATASNAVVDQEVKEFHDALPPVPHIGNPFRVGADAPRLCRIAGKTECGSQGIKRVPASRRRTSDSGDYRGYRLPRLILAGTSRDQQGQ